MKKLIITLFVFLGTFNLPVSSSILNITDQSFFIKTNGLSVNKILNLSAQQFNIPIVISERIDSKFVGVIKNKSLIQILNFLCSRFNLAWYYNGSVLHVVSASEISSSIVHAQNLTTSELYEKLKESLDPSSFYNRVEWLKSSNIVKVTGTPQYIEDAKSIASSITSTISSDNLDVIAKVFPLNYARADDIKFNNGDKGVVVPGVATLLTGILANSEKQSEKSGSSGQSLPKIDANPRQNSINLLGKKSKMAMYQQLINELDQPLLPVNISVNIIDVNEGDLNGLGIDWSVSAKNNGGSISFNNKQINAEGTLSAVIKDSNLFMLKINALKSQAKAKILSSPSVLTLDNMPAILNRKTTFYAKLIGKNSSSLKPISTGEFLSVTPHIISRENEKPIIQMTISIKDGSPLSGSQQIDNLPQTQNSEINTQAKLISGQSLLIGGFVRNEELIESKKIPLLGDIPIIGYLFSTTTHTKRNLVRLFLIKAKPQELSG